MTTAAESTVGHGGDMGSGGRVYVLSNQATGNSVMVFDRAADGRLTLGERFRPAVSVPAG